MKNTFSFEDHNMLKIALHYASYFQSIKFKLPTETVSFYQLCTSISLKPSNLMY